MKSSYLRKEILRKAQEQTVKEFVNCFTSEKCFEQSVGLLFFFIK